MRLVPLLLASTLFAQAAYAADPREAGPLALVITYHTTPANRLALHKEIAESGLRQFQRWKDDGILQGFSIMTNRFVDSGTWDTTAVLNFSSSSDIARWKKIEQLTPAGLAQQGLALATAIDTTPADLIRKGSAAVEAVDPVLLVIPYDVQVSTADYIKYLDGYMIPQLEGWIAEGALSKYSVYIGRDTAGRPWSALLVLEYTSEATLGAREAVKAKVRARLRDNPEWKAISDDKKSIRVEKQVVIADEIVSPASENVSK